MTAITLGGPVSEALEAEDNLLLGRGMLRRWRCPSKAMAEAGETLRRDEPTRTTQEYRICHQLP
jgi:hypothetical protein